MESSEMIAGIRNFSEAMAVAASKDLSARVEHCPEWLVRDLVVHIAGVQWFWANIAEQRVTDRSQLASPSGLPEGREPIEWFREQTGRLVGALSTCPDDTHLWTWWELAQNAGWAKRRQLNEVVIHGWDAANAVSTDSFGADPIPTDMAIVGLDEFVDVMSKDLRDDHPMPKPLRLRATDAPWTATLFAGNAKAGAAEPELELIGTASELLLTLWGRKSNSNADINASISAIDLS
jgi:uncharacterized protein (TIGR03083 family)